MARRAARVTQADIARAIRAVLQVGGGTVVIETDGRIRVEVDKEPRAPSVPVEPRRRLML
jgi:hypothetical protein